MAIRLTHSHSNIYFLRRWSKEVVQVKDDPNFNLNDELTLLEMIWLEKLNLFGEKGYIPNDKIRQA